MATAATTAESTETKRPQNCECDPESDVSLPCWPCYRAGFETKPRP